MMLNPGFAKKRLESTVEWLKSDDEDELSWAAQLDLLQDCLNEMEMASQPLRPVYIGHIPGPNEVARRFGPAMPHVESMLRAMRQGNRKRALEAAAAAISQL